MCHPHFATEKMVQRLRNLSQVKEEATMKKAQPIFLLYLPRQALSCFAKPAIFS